MDQQTLDFYNENAKEYAATTLKGDVTDIRAKFLQYIPQGGKILDLGCGSGRDSLAFKELGYKVVAMDGSIEMCQEAARVLRQDVVCKMFQELDDMKMYDGIWACASLLHVPSNEIKEVLKRMVNALKVGGSIYVSLKEGEFEGIRDGRYFTDYTVREVKELIEKIGEIKIKEVWETIELRNGQEVRWINLILRK